MAHVTLYASRHSLHYFVSIFLTQFVLTSLAFFTFRIAPDELAERLHIDVELVLTSVAFQSAVQGQIPNVPYLTWLEWYVLINFIFLSVICLEHFLASTLNEETCGSESAMAM